MFPAPAQTSPQASEDRRRVYFSSSGKTCIKTLKSLYDRINVYPNDKTRPLPRIQLTGLTGVERDQKPDTKIISHTSQDDKSHFCLSS